MAWAGTVLHQTENDCKNNTVDNTNTNDTVYNIYNMYIIINTGKYCYPSPPWKIQLVAVLTGTSCTNSGTGDVKRKYPPINHRYHHH